MSSLHLQSSPETHYAWVSPSHTTQLSSVTKISIFLVVSALVGWTVSYAYTQCPNSICLSCVLILVIIFCQCYYLSSALLSSTVISFSVSLLELLIPILNPLTPTSDQDKISPYNINIISTRYVMRIKKISIWG